MRGRLIKRKLTCYSMSSWARAPCVVAPRPAVVAETARQCRFSPTAAHGSRRRTPWPSTTLQFAPSMTASSTRACPASVRTALPRPQGLRPYRPGRRRPAPHGQRLDLSRSRYPKRGLHSVPLNRLDTTAFVVRHKPIGECSLEGTERGAGFLVCSPKKIATDRLSLSLRQYI